MRLPGITLVFMAIACLSRPTLARQPDSVTELSRIARIRISAVYDLVAAPPYAYALERENLRVLDVRNPRDVREVANVEFPGPRLWAELYGHGLYMGGFGRPLGVVDVSDPLRPRWVGPVPDIAEPLAALVREDLLFAMESRQGLVLSVSRLTENAGFPRRISELPIDTNPGQRFSGMDYHDGRLYVLLERTGAEGTELESIDVRDPLQLKHERRIALPALHDYRRVTVRGSLAYATIANAEGAFGLATLRLGANDAEILGSVTDARLWNGGRMIVNGDAIYATFKYDAILATFDVSDPRSPRLAHTLMRRGNASGLGLSRMGDRLYVSGDAGPASILDISEPLSPEVLGTWNYAGGWARSVSLYEREAVVLNWGIGFQIYDIADPTTPALLGAWVSHGNADHLSRERDMVLVSGDTLPTEVVDISDPASPVLMARFSVPGRVTASALRFPIAVQALDNARLVITDVRAPVDALSHVQLESAGTDIAIQGNLVIVGHRDGGVTVIDIARPEMPRLTGAADGPAGDRLGRDVFTGRIALTEDSRYAVTIAGEREEEDSSVILSVFDLQTAVSRLASVELPFVGYAQDYTVAFDEGLVLVGAGSDVFLVNLENPAQPRIASHYRVSIGMEGLAKRGRLLVVAASEDGVQFFELPSR